MVNRRKVLWTLAGICLADSVRAIASSSYSSDERYCEHAPTDRGDMPRDRRFGKRSTAEQVTEGLDLSGKTALITGSNSGIGLETLRVLVLRGAHVYALARTKSKAEEACASVMKPGVRGSATPFACEQSQFESVVSCADAIRSLGAPIDMLICNAGLNVPKLEQVNGIEMHFAVQHLSHFILVNRLLQNIKMASQGRVVMVGSCMYLDTPPGGIDFSNLSGERGRYRWDLMYGQSKLANGLFARELTHRLCNTSVTANMLHPGLIPTNITRVWVNTSTHKEPSLVSRIYGQLQFYMWGVRHNDTFTKTIPQGAATTCYVATNPGLDTVSGKYFQDCHIETPSRLMRDDALAAKLWAVSEELVRPYLLPT